jgi:hypothetical protein
MAHKVRTTLRPDVELDIDDAEFTDLSRQGLLVPESPNPCRTTAIAEKEK